MAENSGESPVWARLRANSFAKKGSAVGAAAGIIFILSPFDAQFRGFLAAEVFDRTFSSPPGGRNSLCDIGCNRWHLGSVCMAWNEVKPCFHQPSAQNARSSRATKKNKAKVLQRKTAGQNSPLVQQSPRHAAPYIRTSVSCAKPTSEKSKCCSR